MIAHDFLYCRPDTLQEAAEAFPQLKADGLSPIYYGGGSEIITMCRAGSIRPGAVIDLKSIPECLVLEARPDKLILGAAVTLNSIKESKLFPLLGKACGRVADHTNQCRITLGGNLCGTIIYRETSLPLLLSDADAVLFGPKGMRTVAFSDVFRQRMQLFPGEFAVQIHVPVWALNARYFHIKKTAQEKIDYPLVNVTAMERDGFLRVACSGACPFPFRSIAMEQALNNGSASREDRVQAASNFLPSPALTDVEGSGDYRLFVLRRTLLNLLEEWENGPV